MSVLCFLSAVIFSVLRYHYIQFKPFLELEKKVGEAYFSWDAGDSNIYTSGAKGINGEYNVRIASLFDNDYLVSAYIYDEWVWKNWEPRMKKGKWFSGNPKDDIPDVVIGGDTRGYKVGDTINLTGYVSGEQTATQECRIIGIFQDKTPIFGSREYSAGGEKYTKCYFDTKNEDGMPIYVIIRENDMKKSKIAGVDTDRSIWTVIDFDESRLSEEEIAENYSAIRRKTSGAGLTYSDFMKKSRKTFNAQIMLYIPLFCLAVFLIGIVIYNVTRIDLRDSSYSHSIYYLVGADKKVCRRISLYTLLINVFISVIMFVTEVYIYASVAAKQNINFHLGIDTFIIAAAVYIALIIYTVLVSHLMSRGLSPIDMLRKNRTVI